MEMICLAILEVKANSFTSKLLAKALQIKQWDLLI